jgi:hypothetical protein
LKNFSRNRPETTNLNHQYAIRRVVICRILDAPSGPASWIAPKPGTGCDVVHIGERKHRQDGREFSGSHPSSARRRRPRGCPAPIAHSHTIAIYIAICAVITLAATAMMTEYTGKDSSGGYQSR